LAYHPSKFGVLVIFGQKFRDFNGVAAFPATIWLKITRILLQREIPPRLTLKQI